MSMLIRNTEDCPVIVTVIYESGKRETQRLPPYDVTGIGMRNYDRVIEYILTMGYKRNGMRVVT